MLCSRQDDLLLTRIMSDGVAAAYQGKIILTQRRAPKCLSIFRRAIQIRSMRKECSRPEAEVPNLYHQEWSNSWNHFVKSTESFPELFQKAINETLKTYGLLEQAVRSRRDEDCEAVVHVLGKRSYHSGFAV